MVIEEILESNGLDCQTAKSGEECLRFISGMPYIPDLVLLDMMMPGMSGMEVLEKVREQFSRDRLPVIMISALSSEQVIDQVRGCSHVGLLAPLSLTCLRPPRFRPGGWERTTTCSNRSTASC